MRSEPSEAPAEPHSDTIVHSTNYYKHLSFSLAVTSVLVTGGAGFIGSNLVRRLLASTTHRVVVLDALTYAGNVQNLAGIDAARMLFVHGSINDASLVLRLITEQQITGIINCAAESHVDRSIISAAPFIATNVQGTLVLLEAANVHGLRLLQMSTDEVYGELSPEQNPVDEQAPLSASSPYAASKAAADLLVQAFVRTHDVDAVITRCTNNYGQYQFPEKFLPVMILNAMQGAPLPIYGDGLQVRDWIHVDDHCAAVIAAFQHGRSGEVYNIGANQERTNMDVALGVLGSVGADRSLLKRVADRPGHDRRYALNASKIRKELGWSPVHVWDESLQDTVEWYRNNLDWCDDVRKHARNSTTR